MISNSVRVAEPTPITGSRITAAQFAELIGGHLEVVWRLASYLVGVTAPAEQLVEQCAQLAFARRATLLSSIGFKPWFLGLLVESWQQSAPRHLRLVNHASEVSPGDAYLLAEAAGVLELQDPAGAILEQLAPEDICRALNRLPVDDRVVVALSLADDLSYREIGLVLALSAETVRARLHRGRALLKVAVWEASQSVR